MTRAFRPGVALASFLLLAAIPLAPEARAQVATGVLEALVVDDAGAALPGATVSLRRPETGLSQSAVSDANGLARFGALPPGSYALEASLPGFSGARRESLVLRVGQTLRVPLRLRTAREEAVTVTADVPLVDVYRTDSSANVVPEQIKDLPVANRNFENLAFIAPTVQRERGAFRFIGGGPVIGGGGNASQAAILLDGVDFTDPALGLAKTRISQDAISEFRVVTNRFDSEVGGSAGGALSVVTKSGTNDFKGTAFGFYRDDALRATGSLETGDANFSRGQYGFTLGGPLVKDQTHFFASLEYVDADNVVLFRPGGAYASRAADVGNPFRQTLVYLGLDQRLTDSSRVSLRGDFERYREENFRVGGVADPGYGQQLRRDNGNVTGSWTLTSGALTNEVRAQAGRRKYFEPTNSDAVAEWFTNGTTLQTGGNILGDLLGEGTQFELRDTVHLAFTGLGSHDVKGGVQFQRVTDRSVIDTYATGLLLYASDSNAVPAAFLYGEGSSDVDVTTSRWGLFVQDDWRPLSNLAVNVGLRYDLDTNGNNTGFTSVTFPEPRKRDGNNWQPRLAFSWDVREDGGLVARGGVGLFTGRYLLVPSFQELSFNGTTGRKLRTRVSLPGLLIDRNNPYATGFLLPTIDLALQDQTLDAPEATQASLGVSARLGKTGLYADLEGIWVDGRKEIVIRDENWKGNPTPGRFDPRYGQINVYSNDGRSEYKALVVSLNGNLKGGHLVTASATFGSKKNLADDFSPEFPTGYPNDPANFEAEWGRARSNESFRFVSSAIVRLPLEFTAGATFEYGSGQPWTHRLGYDFNGDGKNSDRPAGVGRFAEDGPPFRQVNLRITKGFTISAVTLELVAEAFNLFDTVNDDVTSVDGAEFFAGPTLANPAAAAVRNPSFGRYRATLSPREIQLGARVRF